MKSLLEKAEHTLIGGHRGCACEYPENSIKAMEEGLRRGADYLEIDVQMTKDGVPVIYHDIYLQERTHLHGYVHEAEYAQMKEAVEGLCTLEEAMRWGAKKNAYFGLELKTLTYDMQHYSMKLLPKISKVLKDTGMTDHVFVFGIDYQLLKELRKIDREVPLGLIVPHVPADPVALMKEMDAVVYLSYIFNMSPKIIRELQEAGYYVSGSILREDKWVQEALKCKVNMFESDNPENCVTLR